MNAEIKHIAIPPLANNDSTTLTFRRIKWEVNEMKTISKFAVAAVAILALVVLPSTAASADQGNAIVGSRAYYITSSDRLSVSDTQADGKSAIAEIRASAGSTIYSVTESRGVNNQSVKTVSMPKSYQIRACVQDLGGGGAKSCSGWANGS